jgi:hypothetical protein
VTVIGWIEHLRRGEAVPGDSDSHDEGNARHAAEFDSTTKEQTLADLEANAATFREFVVTLSPEDLASEGVHGPAGGVVMGVEGLVGASARHPRFHLNNMIAAVAEGEERAS